MRKTDIEGIRKKSLGEVQKLVDEKKRSLFGIRVEIAGGKEKNLKKAKNISKEIAKLLTIAREREIFEKTKQKS